MTKYPTRGKDFFFLYDQFLEATRNGTRLNLARKRIRVRSLRNYEYLRNLIREFCIARKLDLRVNLRSSTAFRKRMDERKQWLRFYDAFSDFLYDDKDLFDTYVGQSIKLLRTFFNFLKTDLGYAIGDYYKAFPVTRDDIQVVSLTPAQFRFLAYDKSFTRSLSNRLKLAKDMFVFGCTVGLRISDLLNLRHEDFSMIGKELLLIKEHSKTGIRVMIKLPPHARRIVLKYWKRHARLFPVNNNPRFNREVKTLAGLAGWTNPCPKQRKKRGERIVVYKDPAKKENYRFCDIISSHTMRRSAITIMLNMGMKEHVVRQISGHCHNSHSFQRYVAFSEALLNNELKKVHNGILRRRFPE